MQDDHIHGNRSRQQDPREGYSESVAALERPQNDSRGQNSRLPRDVVPHQYHFPHFGESTAAASDENSNDLRASLQLVGESDLPVCCPREKS
jgi:hypothetical protein